MSVGRDQRFSRTSRCPICDGSEDDPRGAGKRCGGFRSKDAKWVHCTREEFAGALSPTNASPPTYAHRMQGECRCGAQHGPAVDVFEAIYDYCGPTGALRFQVVRKPGKRFLQRRPVADGWEWKTAGLEMSLYRLPELIAARLTHPSSPVLVLEGEKDVETARSLGFIATCNPRGAGKWQGVADQAAEVLRGAHVVVIADNDEPGKAHARAVSVHLHPFAESVHIVFPLQGKDFTDWVESGADAADILREIDRSSTSAQGAEIPWNGAMSSPDDDLTTEDPPGLTYEDVPIDPEELKPLSLATTAITGLELARALPPLEYIVRSLAMPAGAGAVHVFGGFGFSGKTVAAQQMLLALAAGRAVWKAFSGPSRPLRCSHIDNEQGIALTQTRYQRLARAHGVELEELEDYLRLFVYPKLTNGGPLRLCKEHRTVWKDVMTGRDLLLLDSFSALRDASIQENSAESRSVLDMLGELSEETHCRSLVVHHANKVGEERPGFEPDARQALRGSGAIFDAGDSIYLLSGKKREAVKIEQIKARSHGEPITDFALVISDVPSADDPKWGLSVIVHGIELIEEQRERSRADKDAIKLRRIEDKIRSVLANGVSLGTKDLRAACRPFRNDEIDDGWAGLVAKGEGTNNETKVGRVYKNIHSLITLPLHPKVS